MDFAAVLKKAWEVTWKNKGFWILGILAGCSASGRGNNGQAASGFRGYDFGGGQPPGGRLPEGQFQGLPELERFFSRVDEGTWIAVALAVLGVILVPALVFLVLGVIGQGGVIAGFSRADEGQAVAVEDGIGVFDAFRKAWEILRANLGPVIVMALILILGGGILSAVLGVPFIGVALPAILGFALDSETSIYSGLAVSGLCLVAAIPIFTVLIGVLTTYTTGAWTLTYRRLTGKAGAAAAAS